MSDPAHNGDASGAGSPEPASTRRLSLRRRVQTLDAGEKRAGYITAGATAVVFFALLFPQRNVHPKPHTKPGPLTVVEILAMFLALALLIAIGTAIGRRASLGFALLLTGVAASGLTLILAVPYVGLFIWLIVRAHKTQLAAGVGPAARRRPTSTSSASPSGKARPSPSNQSRSKDVTSRRIARQRPERTTRTAWAPWRRSAEPESSVRRATEPSKRYTPPKRHPGEGRPGKP